ncbi:MAG: efflux RND transporter permease subunit, partial [Mesorhizobium sp.]
TIISISISLVAVFIPVLLMGGVIGRIFNEFAVVVTVAILASMFVSLTLTPMLCSRLLSVSRAEREAAQGEGHRHNFFMRGYDWLLTVCLLHRFLVLLVFIGTAALSAWLIQTSPKGFFPQEDIGQISVTTTARQDISFDAMVKLQGQVADVFTHSPYV